MEEELDCEISSGFLEKVESWMVKYLTFNTRMWVDESGLWGQCVL